MSLAPLTWPVVAVERRGLPGRDGGVPEAGDLLSTAVDPHLVEDDMILQHHRAGARDSRLEAAAREQLTGWHADEVLDSTPAETEEEIIKSHGFSAIVAHAAVSWAQAQGWFAHHT